MFSTKGIVGIHNSVTFFLTSSTFQHFGGGSVACHMSCKPSGNYNSLYLVLYHRSFNEQGNQTSIFGKYLFERRFEIYSFRNICCKISCLPASPSIFHQPKIGIIAYFKQIFTLKRSPAIYGSLFSG